MYFILSKNIGLRSFYLVPYAFYHRNLLHAIGLKKEEFEYLLQCDSKHYLEENEICKRLLDENMIHPCKKDEFELDSFQTYKNCLNRYMPAMNLMITGKCNYNCLHCFNAKDNAPLNSEWTLDEILKLLDDAQNCGIHGFTITGGEPMVHKNFIDILKAIYERDMYVYELNTNGFYITQAILDEMKKIHCTPLIKISFDGCGFHDWMRNYKGAEKRTIDAIKLCIQNGFKVKVQMNINKRNEDSILESLELLDSIGCYQTRIICTTDSIRWQQNAQGSSYSVKEYYDKTLSILHEYIKKERNMSIDVWQFVTVSPFAKTYWMTPNMSNNGDYRVSRPLCQGNRGMIAVGANGNVYPCLQMSGWMEANSYSLGNVKKEGLQSILQDSCYMKEICKSIKDMIAVNDKCRNCKHLTYCRGGCRAIAMLNNNGNTFASDPWKCYFFEHNYYNKCIETLSVNGYKNMSIIED